MMAWSTVKRLKKWVYNDIAEVLSAEKYSERIVMNMENEHIFDEIDEKYSNEYYGPNSEIMRVVSTLSKVTGLNTKVASLMTIISTLEILINDLDDANRRLDYLLGNKNSNGVE